jgi:hypothetical protein
MEGYLTKNAQSNGTVNGMARRVNQAVTFVCFFDERLLQKQIYPV